MIGRRHPVAMLIAGGVALAGILAAQEPAVGPAAAAIGEARAAAPVVAMRWTDPDGKPLPFRSEDELLEFLRTADVKSEKQLSGGVTFPTKVLLEKDGIRADAIFRDVNEQRATPTFGGGRSELYFRDSYVFEPAAYELSLLLGLDNVPPATLRKLRGESGSVQIWVENAMTELKRVKDGVGPPDAVRWSKQLQMMNVFDALVCNTDRNRGNMLITPDWKLWLIDHTRAFRRNPVLPNPGAPNQCERGMYEKLKALDEAVVRGRLKPYLSSYELDALLKRRRLILERLAKLIAERGEEEVLYTYTAEIAPAQPGNQE
ncbi:MAG: hypothetical protein WEF99_07445 [Thermoanaerobaculia bacterium]